MGLGSDFDGMDAVTAGLEDASKYPDLIYTCMAKGATDEQTEGLIGGNLLRVWKRTEDVASMFKKAHDYLCPHQPIYAQNTKRI